ncbi:MAG: hypothetical protein ACM3XS_09650 [Bacteroidota bacterium]
MNAVPSAGTRRRRHAAPNLRPCRGPRRALRRLALAALVGPLVLAAPGRAAEEPISLAFGLLPGQAVAYDGRFVLQIPSGGGKDLVLASVSYGLILRAESASESGGTELVAEYDRFESAIRQKPAGASAPSLVGRRFRLRLAPDLRTPVPPWTAGWSGLLSVCVSWPSVALRVGEGWHDEDRTDLAGGGWTAFSRDYRFCAVEGGPGSPVAVLDYSERGTVAGAPVHLAEGPAMLSGEVRGVGQVRFDAAAGIILSGATVTTFEGSIRRTGAAPIPTRLEAENSFARRPSAR